MLSLEELQQDVSVMSNAALMARRHKLEGLRRKHRSPGYAPIPCEHVDMELDLIRAELVAR